MDLMRQQHYDEGFYAENMYSEILTAKYTDSGDLNNKW